MKIHARAINDKIRKPNPTFIFIFFGGGGRDGALNYVSFLLNSDSEGHNLREPVKYKGIIEL